jgi:hypothetical protein
LLLLPFPQCNDATRECAELVRVLRERWRDSGPFQGNSNGGFWPVNLWLDNFRGSPSSLSSLGDHHKSQPFLFSFQLLLLGS